MPTEFNNESEGELCEYVRKTGREYGVTTGRARRCGYLDLVALRYACITNSIDSLVLTHLDIYDTFDEIEACIAYEIDGKDVEKVAMGAVLGIGGMLALRGLFSFIARAIGILPCDVVSMYFGSTRLYYPAYIAGAVLGFMPDLICTTILGQQIEDVHSPAFWITLAINILACVGSYFFYRWYKKKKGFA